MKKTIALILSALTLCSAAACSAGNGASSPKESTPDEAATAADFVKIDPEKLPAKVDLRNFEGKNYVTPVKCQLYGDCWTFAQAGAAEIAYLFANGMGVPAGEVNDKVNFSEKYISWYVFHGITKDDVAAGKVRASQVGEGFDVSEAEKAMPFSAFIIGGEHIGNACLFSTGLGPVDEGTAVKGEYPYAYDDSWEGEWTLPLNAEYRCLPASAVVKNIITLPNPASTDADGNYSLNQDGLNAVKSELVQGHGVTIGLRSNHLGFNKKNKAAYDSSNESPDHAVAVVGYDDSFPKEKFSRKDSSGKEIEGSTPPADGAFIIKNSWGLMDFDGSADDGYVYLSYYDHSLTPPVSFSFEGGEAAKRPSPNYDQYDLMITQWYGNTDYDKETKMANVFDAEEDESLYQIAYKTSLPNTEVSYEVYKDVEDGNPTSGTLLEKGANSHSYAGFFKIDLKDEYALKKGEKYAVVLTMKRATDENGSMVYTEVFPYSTEFSEGLTVRGVINPGESYLYSDGKWSDMTAAKDSLIERAFKQGVKEIGSRKITTKVSLESKDTFTVDNYPIKGIAAPAAKK